MKNEQRMKKRMDESMGTGKEGKMGGGRNEYTVHYKYHSIQN